MAPLSLSARALHWVFKIGDREASIKFFRDLLGMKVQIMLIFVHFPMKFKCISSHP